MEALETSLVARGTSTSKICSVASPPGDHAWRFADELIEAGITFDMMIYPMRKHGIRDDEAQKHLYKTMLEFWQRQAEVVASSQRSHSSSASP